MSHRPRLHLKGLQVEIAKASSQTGWTGTAVAPVLVEAGVAAF